MEDESLRKDLSVAFEYAYLHDDWVNPLPDALAGITVEKALHRVHPDTTCIWEIVLHTAAWNEDMVIRIQSGAKHHPEEGAWPPLPADLSEQAWNLAKERLSNSLSALQQCILTVPFEKLVNSPYGLPDLICRYVHAGYHLGQITKMQEAIVGSEVLQR